MPTPKPSQHARINLSDIKLQIAKKLGPERSQRYFTYVDLLLAQKLSKQDFNRYCLSVLGRENIPLHNLLICSIFKNAFLAKTPPPFGREKGASKPPEAVGKKLSQEETVVNHTDAPTQKHTVWSNGNGLPSSPRKARSSIRDRKIKDRPSPLGQNGRMDMSFQQSLLPIDNNVLHENGVHDPSQLKRLMQHHQGHPEEHPAKRPWLGNLPPHDEPFVDCQGKVEFAITDAEELEQSDDLNSRRGPLQAPLGIPLCSASVGGAQRSSSLLATSSSGILTSNYYCGELCHSEDLKRRIEKIAEMHGLEGVTLDCSNLLNNGVDAYLKHLIKSCFELSGTKSGHDQIKHPVLRQHPQAKPINGIWPQNHMHGQSCGASTDYMQSLRTRTSISMQDFRVAMELNPQQLGEDWPLLLEKIYLLSFDE